MTVGRIPCALAAALVASLALAGCKKKDEPVATPPPVASVPAPLPTLGDGVAVNVIAVDLGTSVDADNKAVTTKSTFAASDTIHAAVTTDGAASNIPLAARWTYAGPPPMTVNEESRTLNTTGPATTEFHISKPDGFPVGKYKVEISLNGAVVQSREFEVR